MIKAEKVGNHFIRYRDTTFKDYLDEFFWFRIYDLVYDDSINRFLENKLRAMDMMKENQMYILEQGLQEDSIVFIYNNDLYSLPITRDVYPDDVSLAHINDFLRGDIEDITLEELINFYDL